MKLEVWTAGCLIDRDYAQCHLKIANGFVDDYSLLAVSFQDQYLQVANCSVKFNSDDGPLLALITIQRKLLSDLPVLMIWNVLAEYRVNKS